MQIPLAGVALLLSWLLLLLGGPLFEMEERGGEGEGRGEEEEGKGG